MRIISKLRELLQAPAVAKQLADSLRAEQERNLQLRERVRTARAFADRFAADADRLRAERDQYAEAARLADAKMREEHGKATGASDQLKWCVGALHTVSNHLRSVESISPVVAWESLDSVARVLAKPLPEDTVFPTVPLSSLGGGRAEVQRATARTSPEVLRLAEEATERWSRKEAEREPDEEDTLPAGAHIVPPLQALGANAPHESHT